MTTLTKIDKQPSAASFELLCGKSRTLILEETYFYYDRPLVALYRDTATKIPYLFVYADYDRDANHHRDFWFELTDDLVQQFHAAKTPYMQVVRQAVRAYVEDGYPNDPVNAPYDGNNWTHHMFEFDTLELINTFRDCLPSEDHVSFDEPWVPGSGHI